MTDQEFDHLLVQLREGDQAAFAQIYQELSTPVYTILLRILYNRQQAEDLLQEVFLRLYRNPPGPDIKKPRAWLFVIARNLAIDVKRKVAPQPLCEDLADPSAPPETIAGRRADLEAAMKSLSDLDREILTLHLNAGLKFREIAELLTRPLGTVLWRYQKALGSLRDQLSGGAS